MEHTWNSDRRRPRRGALLCAPDNRENGGSPTPKGILSIVAQQLKARFYRLVLLDGITPTPFAPVDWAKLLEQFKRRPAHRIA